MKVNLPFGITENNDGNYYSAESIAKKGVWPLSKNNIWHTGIHLKASERYSLLKPLIPGEIVTYRICDDYLDNPFGTKYSTSLVLMKHYFGAEKVPFFILYSGLSSNKVIDDNEFSIPYESNIKDIFRPLFCRKWTLKSGSVTSEECRYVPYYSDKETTSIAGYINRDGRYPISDTENGFVYTKNNDTRYFLKQSQGSPLGFSKKTTNNVIYIARKSETSNLSEIEVFYDSSPSYPKFKFNPNNLKRINVDNKSLSQEIKFEFYNKSNYTPTFDKSDFYIISNRALTINSDLSLLTQNDLDTIVKYSKTQIGIVNGTYNNVDSLCDANKPFRCFIGDKLNIIESINTTGSFYQYKVAKISTGADLSGSYQKGFICTNDTQNIKKYFSVLDLYDLRNSDNGNINSLPKKKWVKVYDTIDNLNNGVTLCPEASINENEVYEIQKKNNDYFALIKIEKFTDSEKYTYPALNNEGNSSYFWAYVKLNKQSLKDCIKSEYKDNYSVGSVSTDLFADIPSDYNGPIGFFDNNIEPNTEETNASEFELHIELFFTKFDELKYKKRKKKLDGTYCDELIQISSASNLFKSTNETNIQNADFTEDNINYKYFSNRKGSFVPLFSVEDINESFELSKNAIIIQDEELKVKFEKKSREDKNKITKIIAKENKTIGRLEFKKNTEINFSFTDNEYKLSAYINERNTGYIISSDLLHNSSKTNPCSLSNDVIIYKGSSIELTPLESNENCYVDSQIFHYSNVLFIEINGINYIRFQSNNSYYFIKESDIEDVRISNKYEETVETTNSEQNVESSKKYNVFDLPAFILLEDHVEDYSCDINEICDKTNLKIDKLKDNAQENITYTIDELVYTENDKKLYNELNRLIIKCPSMWEKPSTWNTSKKTYIKDVGYWGIPDSKENELFNYLENCFFIDSTNKEKILGTTETQYYFFHPLKFLNYYAKKTLQEFNPYCEKVLVDLPSESNGGVNVVMNNSGFAPCISNNDSFPDSNGLFSEGYMGVSTYSRTKYEFYHEGIDFQASVNTEIKSFIYGEIVSWGWYGSYGRTTFIKSLDNNSLYLLAHQKKYMANISKGKKIGPGDIIGYVGKSGREENSYGAHLHITKYDLSTLSSGMKVTYLKINNKKNSGVEDLKLYEITSVSNELINYRVNPINNRSKKNENKDI